MDSKKASLILIVLTIALSSLSVAQAQKANLLVEHAQQVLQEARKALGGDSALRSIRSLSASGDFNRVAQDRNIPGEITLDLLLPDKFMKTTKMTASRGMSMTRVETVNGDDVWTDMKRPEGGGMRGEGPNSRGGGRMGGGRMGGGWPGGGGIPGIGGGYPGGGRGGTSTSRRPQQEPSDRMGGGLDTPESNDQMRNNLSRLLVALFLSPPASLPLEFSYDREDETDEGKADVLKVTGPHGPLMNLFIDQKTHRPVLASYEALMLHRRWGDSDQTRDEDDEGVGTRRQTEKQEAQIYFMDYQMVGEKGVGDVWLPHRILKMSGGHTQEEWMLKKFKLNPDLKPKKFERKA